MPEPIHLIPLAEIDAAALDRDRTRVDEAALTELRALDRHLRPAHADRGLRPRRAPTTRRPAPLRPDLRLPPPRRLPRPGRDRPRQGALRRHPRLPAHPERRRRRLPPDGRGERHPRRHLPLGAGDGRRQVRPRRGPTPASTPPSRRSTPTSPARSAPACAPSPTSPTTSTATSPPPRPSPSASSSASPPLIPRGYGDLIRATLAETAPTDPEAEWRALLPILLEAERPEPDQARPRPPRPPAPRPRPPPPRPHHPPRADPRTAGPCTSPAATPPATCSTASSTRSTACSARPSAASRRSKSRLAGAALGRWCGCCAAAMRQSGHSEAPIGIIGGLPGSWHGPIRHATWRRRQKIDTEHGIRC